MAQLMMVGTVGERLAGGSKDFVLVRTGKPLAHGEVDLAVAGGRSPRDDGVADPVVVGGDHVGGHLNLPQSTIALSSALMRCASGPRQVLASLEGTYFVSQGLKRNLK